MYVLLNMNESLIPLILICTIVWTYIFYMCVYIYILVCMNIVNIIIRDRGDISLIFLSVNLQSFTKVIIHSMFTSNQNQH